MNVTLHSKFYLDVASSANVTWIAWNVERRKWLPKQLLPRTQEVPFEKPRNLWIDWSTTSWEIQRELWCFACIKVVVCLSICSFFITDRARLFHLRNFTFAKLFFRKSIARTNLEFSYLPSANHTNLSPPIVSMSSNNSSYNSDSVRREQRHTVASPTRLELTSRSRHRISRCSLRVKN